MATKITVFFDGHMLEPEIPLDLEPNRHYVITIETQIAPPAESSWDAIEALAGTVEAPVDWSAEHDHYLYGTPKHSTDPGYDS